MSDEPESSGRAQGQEEVPTLGLAEVSTSVQPLERAPEDTRTTPVSDDDTIARPSGSTPPAARGEQAAFGKGDILAERYRVVRFIARGGMGEVYEVEDLTLHGRLALKTIRPEIAQNPNIVERFKREINAARRITHPNVSRIYDIGVHRAAAVTTMFLTMEFLSGEMLGELIARKGRLTEAESMPIAEQIAGGLAAAHEAGIIHRDFKSPNVMLAPATRGEGTRAVVTDFGLARSAVSEEGLATLSEAGAIMGTPAYMAPEQVEGLKLTPAADIYAFGIVLYEMVTGRRPFVSDTPFSLAVKHLTDTPVAPRQLVPTLDPVWDSVIMRCLRKDPASRFQSALEVARALRESEMQSLRGNDAATFVQVPGVPSSVPVAVGRRRPIGPAIGVAVLAAVLSIAGFVAWNREPERPPEVSPPARPEVKLRHSVAVFPLENLTQNQEKAWLSTAIPEMMANELAAGGIRVAPAHEVMDAIAGLQTKDVRALSPTAREKLRRALGVSAFMDGAIYLEGGLLRVDLFLIDAKTGRSTAADNKDGPENQLFDLVSRLGSKFRTALGGGKDLEPKKILEIKASLPQDPSAARLYIEGVSSLYRYEARNAAEILEQAAKKDPEHPLIRHALSRAYLALGDDVRAVTQAEHAARRASDLNEEQKLIIDERLDIAQRDWEGAIEKETVLWERFRDEMTYGLSLADSQISAGKITEALATIAELRSTLPNASQDARVDLVEAYAYQAAGQAKEQLDSARRAVVNARAAGVPILLGRARLTEASALVEQNQFDHANSAIDEAQKLFEAAGDQSSVARAVSLTARIAATKNLASAQALYERAREIYEKAGNRSGAAQESYNVGAILLDAGRIAEAQPYFDRAWSILKAIGAKQKAAEAMNATGATLFLRGDLDRAEKRYSDALSLFIELRDKRGDAGARTNLGEVQACRGNLESAFRFHQQALAINQEARSKDGESYDLQRLAEIHVLRNELATARSRYEEALKIQTAKGDNGAWETRVALARLAIEEEEARPKNGKAFREAEVTLREAEEILRTQVGQESAVMALSAIAGALLAQGKQKEALATARSAWTQAEAHDDFRVRFHVAVTMARVLAASRNPVDVQTALNMLESKRLEAARNKFVALELETRLALGGIEVAAGKPSGKSRLSALAAEARAKGFQRIAARASGTV